MRRLAFVLALAGLTLVALAAPAFAHVTLRPNTAVKGSFATVAVQVPNERDAAKTVKVELQMPTNVAIASVSVQPVAGWTIETTTRTLDEPIEREGGAITEVVDTITWTAADGGGISPGEFQQFLVAMGRLPEDVDTLKFPAIQTYDNGDVASWVQEGEDAELPAPTLTLEDPEPKDTESPDTTVPSGNDGGDATASASAIKTAQDDADTAKTIAIVGVVAGILGIVVGAIALATRKRAA